MRCILVVLDGIGDRGQPVFKGKTPLQAALTPNLDKIARHGMCGLYHSSLQGIAMPSETAHFLMFGYESHEFPGRGLIEALGEGVSVKDDEVAILARIFSVSAQDDMMILTHENPAVDQETCHILQNEIRYFQYGAIEIEFVPYHGIQGILILRGDISPFLTDSNPIFEGRPLMEVFPFCQYANDPDSIQTAEALNNYLLWCHKKLSGHPINKKRVKQGLPPINAMGTQRPGKRGPITSFREKWGLKGLSIASGPVFWGLSELLGMDGIREKDTENMAEDLKRRLELADKAKEYDFIHVHTKMPDVASHTKNPGYKRRVIEELDSAFSYAIHEIVFDPEILFVVTADHSTPSSGPMIHSGETVPICMIGQNTRKDEVKRFNEINCAQGGLGLMKGKELMYLVLNFMDRAKLKGLMDSPENRPYTPGPYKPLKLGHE